MINEDRIGIIEERQFNYYGMDGTEYFFMKDRDKRESLKTALEEWELNSVQDQDSRPKSLDTLNSISNIAIQAALEIKQKTKQWEDFPKFSRLYHLVSDPYILAKAYLNICKNKGAMTAGIDKRTIDGYNLDKLERLRMKL